MALLPHHETRGSESTAPERPDPEEDLLDPEEDLLDPEEDLLDPEEDLLDPDLLEDLLAAGPRRRLQSMDLPPTCTNLPLFNELGFNNPRQT